MYATHIEFLRAVHALQVAFYEFLDSDVNDHQAFDGMKAAHSKLTKLLKQIEKETL